MAYFNANWEVYTFLSQNLVAHPFAQISFVTFVTGFFTSIWLWLQFVTVVLARLLVCLKPVEGLIKYLRTEDKPISTLALLSFVFMVCLVGLLELVSSPWYEGATIGSPQMVDVSAGIFEMGCTQDDDQCNENEYPRHMVKLDEFKIDKTEVSVKAFTQCLREGKCQPHGILGPSCTWLWGPNYPMNCVSWQQAKDYCKSLGDNYDLPSEAQWEKAARGSKQQIYPWGNNLPTCDLANFSNCSGIQRIFGVIDELNIGMKVLYFQSYYWTLGKAKIVSYPENKSPYGVYDMAGNVSEWVDDCYVADTYVTRGELTIEPRSTCNSGERVVRGRIFYQLWRGT